MYSSSVELGYCATNASSSFNCAVGSFSACAACSALYSGNVYEGAWVDGAAGAACAAAGLGLEDARKSAARIIASPLRCLRMITFLPPGWPDFGWSFGFAKCDSCGTTAQDTEIPGIIGKAYNPRKR